MSEQIYKIAFLAAGGALLIHILTGDFWAYLFGAGLLVGLVAYAYYKLGPKH